MPVKCVRCGYEGCGSNGLCPLCGGELRNVDFSKSFPVKKGWLVFEGGMERVVIKQTLLEAFS
ncbi:hypothetical protein [Geoglobus acetivorans]|uniref:Uncharacterized protein n=1 Tax=Geoglobus acetivorans TaxID=565033 RepID=A0A0A7GD03_GEOAI|nr:hypothetical protein GACE_0866 [Geoglobus acetivorans]